MSKEFNEANANLLQLITKEGVSKDEIQASFNECNAMRKKLPNYGDNKKYLYEMESMYIGIQGAINDKFRGKA